MRTLRIALPVVGAMLLLCSCAHQTATQSEAPSTAATISPLATPASGGELGASSTITQSPSTEASASVASAEPAASPTNVLSGAAATPAASPSSQQSTPDPNLLTAVNGAFVRRWTTGAATYGVERLVNGAGIVVANSFAKPIELVFELPETARFSAIGLRSTGTTKLHGDFAVSDDGRTFAAAGRVDVDPSSTTQLVLQPIQASGRFVKVTVTRDSTGDMRLDEVVAVGTLTPPARRMLDGYWMSADASDGSSDSVFAGARGFVPQALPPKSGEYPRVTFVHDGVLTEFSCTDRSDVWRGSIDGTRAIAPNGEALNVVADGNALVGFASKRLLIALRVPHAPACVDQAAGRGPVVLVLGRQAGVESPDDDVTAAPGYRFERALLPLVDAPMLRDARIAVIAQSCAADMELAPWQQKLLLDWVGAGHTLIVRDADSCTSSAYAFIPYPFRTNAAGAGGASGHVLAIADPSTLGSLASDPAHEIDTKAYIASATQQIGDADVMQTDDPHWCGLMFARNASGASGWVHAYARYGRGLLIYNGFDRDDLRSHVPEAQKLARVEYEQLPSGELPCNAEVASDLALYSSVNERLAPGALHELRVPMTLDYVALKGNPIAATLTLAGNAPWKVAVAPSHVTLNAGAAAQIVATVVMPASARPARYVFTVTASGGSATKQSAQASITIDASIALAKELLNEKRATIYGIHFDVASATIQAQSEATIAQIAQVLRAYPTWKMRVEGHTDSDGGAAYNLDLSRRRALAVVAVLEHRYHIARGRLAAEGFGLTRPVASNATAAGKALNRRVELVRL
ncbi:MAG TPA: OmpA family protein [Candidatus Eremiobacteraceae bacterium]